MENVVIYTKNYCPYCVRAKSLLSEKGVKFREVHLDQEPEKFQELKEKTGLMTVPQIFINEKLVGGFDDLSSLEQAGELDSLLGSPINEAK